MRALSGVLLLISSAVFAQQTVQQRTAIETTRRTIRQDVPMTNSIRKAFAAGTRDFSGKPGPNYWQLETDYTIQASLDPSTQTITGTEKILVHNNSNEDLRNLVLRLDHNIFRPEVPRGFSTPAEATEGMVVTGIKIAGAEIDQKAIRGLNRTIATVTLKEPIKARTNAEVEIAISSK